MTRVKGSAPSDCEAMLGRGRRHLLSPRGSALSGTVTPHGALWLGVCGLPTSCLPARRCPLKLG